MQPFRKHTGIVVPIDRVNVDTDQIVPKQFIKWVTNGDWTQGVTCTQETGVYSVKLVP